MPGDNWHPDDETLSAYADDPRSVQNSHEIRQHLEECDACAFTYDGLREFIEVLGKDYVWQYHMERSNGSGVPDDVLREFRNRVRDSEEDRDAVRLLDDTTLSDPFALVWGDLSRTARYRTGGVVRRLCSEVTRFCEIDPMHARNLAESAQNLVEALDEREYGPEAITLLRGDVLKARANALRKLGDFRGAREAIARARKEYGRITNANGVAGMAASSHVEADLFSAMGRFEEAQRSANDAAATFALLGDKRRHLSARMLAGVISWRRNDFVAARNMFATLLNQAEADGDLEMVARLSTNLATARIELGETALASQDLVKAVSGWEALDRPTEAAKVRWTIARLLVTLGRFQEAAERLIDSQRELTELGMSDDVALVRLHLVEALLLAGRHADAIAASKGLVRELHELDLAPAALTALGYVQELAADSPDQLTLPRVRYASRFLDELRDNPSILFAPPMEEI